MVNTIKSNVNISLTKMLLTLAMTTFACSNVANANLTGTLDKIKKTGVVVVGHRESSIPFSYYDKSQNVIGYSQEYSNLIVEALKKELDLPNLTVKYLPITPKTRIQLLNNQTYDFECGSTTNNKERQKVVDFSNTIFIVGTRFLVKNDNKINSIDDLKGKNVVTTSGTTSEVLLNKYNVRNKTKMRIITPKDHADSFNTLQTGRAVAFLMDDALLAGERTKAITPSNWKIVGEPLSYEAYGCMLRKNDPQFKALADKVIADAQKSGVAATFYNKWFTQPLPMTNANMDLALSDKMKELFLSPNSNALD